MSSKVHQSRFKGTKKKQIQHGRFERWPGGAVPQSTRTPEEQLKYLDTMGFTATKERQKLKERIEKRDNKKRNNEKKDGSKDKNKQKKHRKRGVHFQNRKKRFNNSNERVQKSSSSVSGSGEGSKG